MEIWTYCLSRQIWITAKHLPGLMNSEADYASRNFNKHTEWMLDPIIFQQMQQANANAMKMKCNANETRQRNRATNCPTLARPTLVSQSYGDVGGLSSTITSSPSDNFPSIRPRGSTPIVENPAISGMANFRSCLETAGLPEEVCQVIMASWQGSTQQRYEGPWKVWTSWCVQRQKCPFSAPVNDILTFLAEQFNSRHLAYRTIAVYKACISQLHDPFEGRQLGNLPLVSRFMKGIFELRPPQPKLCWIWPVSKVLSHVAGLEPLEGLLLKDLTLKLTILLALTSAARAHELAALNLTSALIKQDACEFTIPIHVKMQDHTIHHGR